MERVTPPLFIFHKTNRIQTDEEVRLTKLVDIITNMLPTSNKLLASYLLEFLHEVSLHSSSNKMSVSNLATVFGPILLRYSDDSSNESDNNGNVALNINNIIPGLHQSVFTETSTVCEAALTLIKYRDRLFGGVGRQMQHVTAPTIGSKEKTAPPGNPS